MVGWMWTVTLRPLRCSFHVIVSSSVGVPKTRQRWLAKACGPANVPKAGAA
ncbi:MAG TPA: hypothetical protein VK439_11250 [Rubrivivax sp.]|nr:hypothetical protein [Rubrivivax sp.]